VRIAEEIVWSEVELDGRWLEVDLNEMALRGKGDIGARVAVHNNNNVVRNTLVDICYRSGISAGKELDIVNNLQTQTSNTLHNAIMEADSKDRPPMLAPGNYVQWKSRIKRYINTKPNHELIHYCLENPLYELGWKDVQVPVSEGSLDTRTEWLYETYKNVSQEIRDQLNAKAEAVQIILTGIDNDIYSTVDACANACEMWKAIQRLKQVNEIKDERIARVANLLALFSQQQLVYNPQNHPTHYNKNSSTRSHQAATRKRGKVIVNSPQPIYDQEPSMVADDDETSKDKEIDKRKALISLSFKKIYKPTNNNLRTSSNTSRANQDNSPRINRGTGYKNQRLGNVAGARESVGSTVDAAYHREKMLLCKQEEAGIQLNAEEADWKDDTDDESGDQELEAHYMYMAKIQEVSPDAVDSGPIFDTKPDQKKSQAELKRRDSIGYASEMEITCAKVKEMKNMLSAHQDTISILKQQKEAHIKLYKSREDKEIEKVIDLENKVKVLDNIVYKTAPESDEVIRLEKESRSKLSDLIKPFDYAKLNSLYDLFVLQREKSSKQRYFSERS
nr:ribonuclease H-like domain-containing protein [Tanacetum cinerariifolium]